MKEKIKKSLSIATLLAITASFYPNSVYGDDIATGKVLP